MTKEELEKETAEYFKSICGDYNEEYERTGKRHYWVGFDIKNAYLAGAEPREKQIQIDAEQIRALQKQNGELTDKVNELEDKLANADYQLEGRDLEIKELKAQIEKMKSCTNCINNYFLATEEPCCSCTRCYASTTKKTTDKWEIKEK